MQKFSKIASLLLLVLIITLYLVDFGSAPDKAKANATKIKPVTINVSAAASLKEALEEINLLYQKEKPHVTVTFNYGSSGKLQSQIENGAPADLFISAAKKNMDNLQSAGLIDESSRKNLVQNKLVLIVPKDSAKVKNLEDLASNRITDIALGEPVSVPAGKYAKVALTNLKLWSRIEAKSVYGSDVRQVLKYVETGNADAGFVYYTDALNSTKVKLVQVMPAHAYSPILYPMATIKNNPHPYTAQDFANFLQTNKARDIFLKYGFTFV